MKGWLAWYTCSSSWHNLFTSGEEKWCSMWKLMQSLKHSCGGYYYCALGATVNNDISPTYLLPDRPNMLSLFPSNHIIQVLLFHRQVHCNQYPRHLPHLVPQQQFLHDKFAFWFAVISSLGSAGRRSRIFKIYKMVKNFQTSLNFQVSTKYFKKNENLLTCSNFKLIYNKIAFYKKGNIGKNLSFFFFLLLHVYSHYVYCTSWK